MMLDQSQHFQELCQQDLQVVLNFLKVFQKVHKDKLVHLVLVLKMSTISTVSRQVQTQVQTRFQLTSELWNKKLSIWFEVAKLIEILNLLEPSSSYSENEWEKSALRVTVSDTSLLSHKD